MLLLNSDYYLKNIYYVNNRKQKNIEDFGKMNDDLTLKKL